jgi:lipopolysaccharide transport protein LptA
LGLLASGEHLESQVAGGETVLTGKPAVLLTKKGELRAPEIRLRRGGELLEALGEVDARVPRADLAWVGPTESWIQIRAARAQWQRTGSTWSFDGGVRAWSGSDVLTADQLRGDTAGASLIASGNVQTVARVARDGGGPAQPLKVRSDNLEYRPDSSRALYRGNVVATEPGRTIEANELEVGMDPNGQADTVWLRGAVSLVEQTGRKVTAAQAEYTTKAGRIVFEGEPVVVEDGKGGRLAGRRVEYDTKSGQVRVGGGQTDG